MHVKVSTVRRKGKTYKYAQLVESYRRKQDGKPTIRVIASLGRVSDDEVHNLRMALKANATGQTLALADAGAEAVKVAASKRYLDCAVLVELWEQVGLRRIVERVLVSEADVAAERCVAALAIQRCIEPGSKLFAQRWLPRTALPALLNLRPSKFNNSRIHRVLDLLASQEDALQRAWSREQSTHAFTTLFLDTSDTWFVGSGPELAHKGRTKEGLFRQKVGIALLCEQNEMPLRWNTYPGNMHEAEPMLAVIRQVADEGWATDVPLVVDRGLGSAMYVGELIDLGVRFIAAVPRHEFEAYAPELGGVTSMDDADPTSWLQKQGFERVDDTCFVRDLGIRSRTDTRPTSTQPAASRSAHAMLWLNKLEAAMEAGLAASWRAVARHLDVSDKFVRALAPLLSLPKEIRVAIAKEATPTATMEELRKLASIDGQAQRAAFEALRQRSGRPVKARAVGRQDRPRQPLRARCVAYFNPEQYAHQRQRAQERVSRFEQRLEELNARLQRAPKRSDASIFAEVGQWLRRHSMLTLFNLSIERTPDRAHPQVRATLNEPQWQQRRRLDGFSLLVASVDCAQPSAELVATYRARQAIERNFRDIKSVIGLRPVHHQTDDKVRAHVTICILALVLQRALQLRLDQAGINYSAPRVLEELDSCRLLELAAHGQRPAKPIITQPNPVQREVLTALDLAHLYEHPAV